MRSLSNINFSKGEVALIVLGVIALVVLCSALVGVAFMVLCGILFAEFGWLAPIGFWPAWGITSLTAIVFRSVFNASGNLTKND